MLDPESPKITFQLQTAGERLLVRASSPAGEGKAEIGLPEQNELVRLDELEAPAYPAGLQRTGQLLYNSLLSGEVGQLAAEVLHMGLQEQAAVQFELRFDPDQVALAEYPWELIQDEYGRFLVRDGLVDVVRYVSYPRQPPSLDAGLSRTKLLRLLSSPRDLPPLFQAPIPSWEVEPLEHATFEQFVLSLLLKKGNLWGLHFDGHGRRVNLCSHCKTALPAAATFCPVCGHEAAPVTALAFENNGLSEWVTTGDFGAILYNAEVKFALLLACETGNVGGDVLFNSLAPGLILAGVPSVVGMQCRISDRFANDFLNAFYAALFAQRDVLSALRTARRRTLQSEWYSPVLYMRYKQDEPKHPLYQVRKLDTAVPARVQPGVYFLTKAWLRRPETPPVTLRSLGMALGIAPSLVQTAEADAEVRFTQVPGRKLRSGDVEISLFAGGCEVNPPSTRLFVSENLDAPPAFFSVRPLQTGPISLVFTVRQDGLQIAGAAHTVIVNAQAPVQPALHEHSNDIEMESVFDTGMGLSREGVRQEEAARRAEAEQARREEQERRAARVRRQELERRAQAEMDREQDQWRRAQKEEQWGRQPARGGYAPAYPAFPQRNAPGEEDASASAGRALPPVIGRGTDQPVASRDSQGDGGTQLGRVETGRIDFSGAQTSGKYYGETPTDFTIDWGRQRQRRRRTILVILSIIVLLLLVAGAIYLLNT